jgi:hypothetical protein
MNIYVGFHFWLFHSIHNKLWYDRAHQFIFIFIFLGLSHVCKNCIKCVYKYCLGFCSWRWLNIVIWLSLSFWFWSILEVQTYITSINENKSQIIKAYCTITIIIVTSIKIMEFIFCNIKFISIRILTMLYIPKVSKKYEFCFVNINLLMFVVVLWFKFNLLLWNKRFIKAC